MCNRNKKDQLSKNTEEIKEDINTLAEEITSQASKGYQSIKKEAQTTLKGALHSVKTDFEHGLGQYNAKVEQLANKIYGGLGKEVANFPWVSITIALVIGVMVGGFLKPMRRS